MCRTSSTSPSSLFLLEDQRTAVALHLRITHTQIKYCSRHLSEHSHMPPMGPDGSPTGHTSHGVRTPSRLRNSRLFKRISRKNPRLYLAIKNTKNTARRRTRKKLARPRPHDVIFTHLDIYSRDIEVFLPDIYVF